MPVYALLVVIVAATCFALTNAILGVNSPRLDQEQSAITIYALQPQECRNNGLSPTSIIAGTNGTTGSDLILGTNAAETITGRGGNDCLVGGNGNDTLNGGAGNNDVCVGGPGTDTFNNNCEHQYQ